MSVSAGLDELWAMCMVDARRLIARKREHDERRIATSSDLGWPKEWCETLSIIYHDLLELSD